MPELVNSAETANRITHANHLVGTFSTHHTVFPSPLALAFCCPFWVFSLLVLVLVRFDHVDDDVALLGILIAIRTV